MAKKASAERARDILAAAAAPPTRQELQFLRTGSTLINIGLSGRWDGGWVLGGYNLVAGGSSSGKTMLLMSTLAEAANDERFDGYDLVFDGPEGGALMNLASMFGSRLQNRLRAPMRGTSFRVEEFYGNLRAHAAAGRPFVWVLDSMDALSSDQEHELHKQHDAAVVSGEALDGSYGDGKAKVNSQNIRTVMEFLQSSNSLLLIICQTRDSLGGTFSPDVYSGGRALRFYADNRAWTNHMGVLKKTVRGEEITVGNIMKFKCDKNRIRGRNFDVEVPIYYHIGLDDIGSCVEYLVDRRHWKKEGQNITVPELGMVDTAEAIIKHAEDIQWTDEIRLLCQDVWMADEERAAATVQRASRWQ